MYATLASLEKQPFPGLLFPDFSMLSADLYGPAILAISLDAAHAERRTNRTRDRGLGIFVPSCWIGTVRADCLFAAQVGQPRLLYIDSCAFHHVSDSIRTERTPIHHPSYRLLDEPVLRNRRRLLSAKSCLWRSRKIPRFGIRIRIWDILYFSLVFYISEQLSVFQLHFDHLRTACRCGGHRL